MLALHYVHLRADFPNHSPWMDWSKYTDEGWYGDAAIRHFQLGHWNLPGDFNPGAALPVWPLLEALVFHFTGVSLVAARALAVTVFAATLLAAWLLITRSGTNRLAPNETNLLARSSRQHAALAASAAVLMLAASPFCYAFTRLAILEPPLVLFTLLALLSAQALRPVAGGGIRRELRHNWLPVAALGLLIPVMILTKTTAIFLLPAVFWMLLAALGFRLASAARLAAVVAALALALWGVYFFAFVRPHFLADYRYLFDANAYTFITRDSFLPVLEDMVRGGRWLGKALFLCALAAMLVALLRIHRLHRHPLVPALLLWIFGYAAFLVYHNNLQPRYYYVIAVPLTLLVPVTVAELVLPHLRPGGLRIAALLTCAGLLLAVVLPDALRTLNYVRHPEYTLVQAAAGIRRDILAARQHDPAHPSLLLSISGSELSLMTGLPSIDDDFGTLELESRIARYPPGWYAAWNSVEDDKMDALTRHYHLERVASFPAMDDPDRDLLILYRLDPAPQPTPSRHRRKPVPRPLRTRHGQQPSTTQLQH